MLRLKNVLKEKNISQKKLAELLNIAPPSANSIINGNPSLKTLEKVAEALNIDILELIDPSKNFAHFYDPETKKWLGVREK